MSSNAENSTDPPALYLDHVGQTADSQETRFIQLELLNQKIQIDMIELQIKIQKLVIQLNGSKQFDSSFVFILTKHRKPSRKNLRAALTGPLS